MIEELALASNSTVLGSIICSIRYSGLPLMMSGEAEVVHDLQRCSGSQALTGTHGSRMNFVHVGKAELEGHS